MVKNTIYWLSYYCMVQNTIILLCVSSLQLIEKTHLFKKSSIGTVSAFRGCKRQRKRRCCYGYFFTISRYHQLQYQRDAG